MRSLELVMWTQGQWEASKKIRCIAVQLYCRTAVQLYCSTAVQLYCCTAVLLYNCTVLHCSGVPQRCVSPPPGCCSGCLSGAGGRCSASLGYNDSTKIITMIALDTAMLDTSTHCCKLLNISIHFFTLSHWFTQLHKDQFNDKNPAYGRQRISWPMRIVSPIFVFFRCRRQRGFKPKKKFLPLAKGSASKTIAKYFQGHWLTNQLVILIFNFLFSHLVTNQLTIVLN